jgi:hypothetical protein
MNTRYRIELRQRELVGLNARHYFWVKKRVLPSGETKYLEEMHGFAADRKTGKPLPFSLGGDPLRFYKWKRRSDHYKQSLGLPYVVALEDTKEEIDWRWKAGVEMGDFVNKTRTEYTPLRDNSNAMATTVGAAMGLQPNKVLDPQVGGEAVQPFAPGLGNDLGLFHDKAPWGDQRLLNKNVGGFGQLDRIDGEEQTLDPFADPFRDDIPL